MSTTNGVLSISRITIIGWILYLASKDDDIIDDPGSLVLQELLNDVFADGTGPDDGKVLVTRHAETVLSV